MAIKHERLGMRRNLAFWLVSSILLLSISKHAIQSLDFTRKKRKLIAATTSLRFVEFRSSGITDEFVFLLSFSISSRIKGTRILFLPFWKDRDFQRSAHLSFHFFSLLLFFFFFFFPLPFLSREYRSLSTSTRLRNLGYHGGHCADSRIGIKFQYTITLDPDFFYLIYPIRLIFLLAVPISK